MWALAAFLEADPGVVRRLKGVLERVRRTKPSIDPDVECTVGKLAAHLAPPITVKQCRPNELVHGSPLGRR